jgi:dihydroxy-acid dehydratase
MRVAFTPSHATRTFFTSNSSNRSVGGSTNGILHTLAIANEAGLGHVWNIDRYNAIAERVPLLGNFSPSGRYQMEALDQIGGLPILMKHLLDKGVLHGDVMTCTGKTLAENLAGVGPLPGGQDVVFPFDKPLAAAGQHLIVLKGNLAPNGCVIKLSGKALKVFTGPARVYDSEDAAFEAIQAGKIVKGDVLVIRCGAIPPPRPPPHTHTQYHRHHRHHHESTPINPHRLCHLPSLALSELRHSHHYV